MKYYVVWRGKEPGIYDNWPDCQKQVHGFAGAAFKSFKTEAEARDAFARPVHESIALPVKKAAKKTAVGGNSDIPATETDGAENAPEMGKIIPEKKEIITGKGKTITGLEKTSSATAAPSSHGNAANACHRSLMRQGGFPLNPPDWRNDTVLPLPPEVEAQAWAVDAACSGNPGRMEYRGVDLRTGEVVFHLGPVFGTNNIGEFLAIVHALALMKKKGICLMIYSDSRNAILWVKKGKCNTKLAHNSKTAPIYDLIGRAEAWLAANGTGEVKITKWETSRWGEIPADFGRK